MAAFYRSWQEERRLGGGGGGGGWFRGEVCGGINNCKTECGCLFLR